MSNVTLIDTTLRDANQSIWGAVGLNTAMISELAPLLDAVGYQCAELITSSTMSTSVRYLLEDPWRRIETGVKAMPNTMLGFLTTGKRFITWHRTSDRLFELAFQLLVRHGVRRIWIIDPMNVTTDAARMAVMAKKIGFEEVIVGIVYSISPIHTDKYFASRCKEIDAVEAIDGLYLKDPGGLLTPQRLGTLVPTINSGLERLSIKEIHSHCNTGLSPRVVLDAADLGIERIHCALDPVANGPSHPPAMQLVRNLRSRGHRVDVDDDALRMACEAVQRIAEQNELPLSTPAVYDEGYFNHQIPGGVVTTLSRQLQEMGRLDMLPAIQEEVAQVRRDLGYPILVTPFSQYVVTQAMMNVLTGERYSRIPDEVASMVAGEFGPLPGRVDPQVLDRVHSQRPTPVALPEESMTELRTRLGHDISDEELLLRAVMPQEQVDNMKAAEAESSTEKTTFADAVRQALAEKPKASYVSLSTGDMRFSLHR